MIKNYTITVVSILMMLSSISLSTLQADKIDMVWGIDENAGTLFSFDDYATHGDVTNHCKLMHNGRAVGQDIESFAFDPFSDGAADMIVNHAMNDDRIKCDHIRFIVDSGLDDMEVGCVTLLDLSIDNDVNGLTFANGKLCVSDTKNSHLYQADLSTEDDCGSDAVLICELTDKCLEGGVGTSVNVEALIWNPHKGEIISANALSGCYGFLIESALGDGGNKGLSYCDLFGESVLPKLGMRALEGMGYYQVNVPEPMTLSLLGIAGAFMVSRNKKK